MTTEQETLERLKARLYPDGQEEVRESKTPAEPTPGRIRVSLEDLGTFLAENPTYRAPKGKAMMCVHCGRPFGGGAFRVCFQVGWLCRHCYGLLALAPLSAKCVHCKQKIAIDDWRYKLWAVTQDDDGNLKRWFVHQGCEREMRRQPLSKAA